MNHPWLSKVFLDEFMITAYITISIIFCILLLVCALKIDGKGAVARMLQPLLSMGIFSIILNVIYILANDAHFADIVLGIFNLSIDLLLMQLLRFALYYTDSKVNFKAIHCGLLVLVGTDGIGLITNFWHHMAYRHIPVEVEPGRILYVRDEVGILFGYHVIVCYIIVLLTIIAYGIGISKSSSAYRGRYLGILCSYSVTILGDCLSCATKSYIKFGVLAFSIQAIAIYLIVLIFAKDAEQRIMRTEVLRRIQNGIICFDEKGRVVFANKIFWEQLETEPQIDKAEGQIKEYFDAGSHLKTESDKWNLELDVKGENKYFEVESQNFFDRKNRFKGCYFGMTDRTERHTFYTNQLKNAMDDSRNKAEILSRTSHAIRTPANTIYGMNEMILRECKDPEILKYAEHIKNSSDVLIDLLDDIVDFSNIEAEKLELETQNYHPDEMVRNVYNATKERAELKGLEYTVSLDEKIPSVLHGDRVRIEQILVNLISNAINYTESGFVKVNIAWDRNGIRANVKDSGIGIKEESMSKLFNAYAKVEDSSIDAIKGTGLGLSITAKLVDMMSGTIGANSIYGVGSNFEVFIPQTVKNPKRVGRFFLDPDSRNNAVADSVFVCEGARVLVVDDNTLNRRVFCNFLKNSRMRIDEASGGQAALDLLKTEKYDIIFIDYMMPDMDGMETFQKMKEMKNCPNVDVPTIMLTANVLAGVRDEYIRVGFTDFLSKPINPNKLEDMLRTYIRKN